MAPIALGYGQKQTWTLALVFFENLLVARMGGTRYRDLFWAPKPGDAFTSDMTYALEDFRKLISYSSEDARDLVWDKAMLQVLKGEAAMTVMGDWAKGYANGLKDANGRRYDGDTFGFIPMPGTAGTFIYTTDTFGLPVHAAEDTIKLLTLFGSQDGQAKFNRIKGSISARLDVDVDLDDDRRPTYDEFKAADANGKIFPATSILAQQTWVDAMSLALANFASDWPNALASEVQHTMDNYADLLRSSCWPHCLQ
jgi:glucose/mannose transport system substrate-binding protein